MAERILYQLARPPGWAQIEIGDEAGRQVALVAASVAGTVDAQNRVVAEQFITDQLRTAVDLAADNGGQDLFFPTEPIDDFIIPLSILVAVPVLPAGSEAQPRMHALTAFAAATSNASVASVAGEPAIRAMKDVDAVVDDDGNLRVPATRQISYVLWAPGSANRLMTIVGSLVRIDSAEGPELTEALEFLFDTMVDTIRFPAEVVSDV